MSKKIIDTGIDHDTIESILKVLKVEPMEDFGKPSWFLPTGNLGLDYIISGRVDGTGGYPGGRVVEIFGEPSTGKTLLLAKAGASIQALGGLFIVADSENRWDSDFASFHGVNPSKVLGFNPSSVEEFSVAMSDILDKVMKDYSGIKSLVVLDSAAALSTLKEEEDVGIKADQGRKAQRIKAAMRVLAPKFAKANTTLLVTNHVIANVGMMYGPSRTAPGGGGFPFHSSVRIELLRTEPIKLEKKDRPIGVTLHCKCTKNSITYPLGQVYIDVFWSRGLPRYSGLLDIMLDLEIVEQSGSWYKYKDASFREKDIEEIIIQHPELLIDPKWEHPYFIGEYTMEEEESR